MTRSSRSLLLGTSQVARQLSLSENRIRDLANAGVLAHTRDAANRRLFRQEDIEAFRNQRAAR
jgi:excisionase family DNA binding protein